MFEMMGHHAFNKNIDEIYWKEKTVSYCDEFFGKVIGIPRELINYKEQLWIGGGNAGPCIEVIAGGLEIATLVFMNMNEDQNGNIILDGKKYSQNPLNIVDTGYGLERIAWFTKGSQTIYDAVFPEMIDYLLERSKGNPDMSSIYVLADHSKCLAFMLGDGIVPSNVKAGYLARLIIRRSLRFIEKLNLNISLKELVDMQLNLLERDFPSLKKKKEQIEEILDIETKKFSDTLSKGETLVRRILKNKEKIDENDLISLYDTHGMPPDFVKNIAKKNGLDVIIPKNFDSMIAELHSHENKEEIKQKKQTELPETDALYYKDHYIKEFDAKVLWKNKTKDGTKIILDKTAFYPEGGGQPSDTGFFEIGKEKIIVKHVERKNNSIIHLIEGDIDVGEKVHAVIDWERRYILMKHHTGTHLVNAALRKILGEHIWQAGSQLGVKEARFDFSHYKSISKNEKKQIEDLANQFIRQAVPVEKKIMKRNDAERTYGFRLYQGGVPVGDTIRVINIPNIDVEACGGTHLNNTQEVERIKILKTERVQDGVNRIIFAAGKMVDVYQKEEDEFYNVLIDRLSPVYSIKKQKNTSEQLQEATKVFSVPTHQLEKTIQRFLKETENIQKKKKEFIDLKSACKDLFNEWKAAQKQRKKVSSSEINRLKDQAEIISGTKIKIITAKSKFESTAIAGSIVKEPNYVVHIYDGTKVTSAASDNVAIDLRKIAPELGKILGGSGGGKPKMTQSGGPKKEETSKALEKARELTIRLLTKKQ